MSNYKDFLPLPPAASAPPSGILVFSATDSYTQNQLVTYNGKIYRAKQGIAPGGFTPSRWEEIGAQLPSGLLSAFSPTLTYNANDLVIEGNQVYRAKAAITSPGIFNPAQWDQVQIGATPTPPGVEIFSATEDYAAGDFVTNSGRLYRANKAITAKAWDATDWDIVVPDQIITRHDLVTTYAQDDIVVENGGLYKALRATGPGAFTAADWQRIDTDGFLDDDPIVRFDTGTNYAANEAVFQNGRIYTAKAAVAAGPFDLDKWKDITRDIPGYYATAPTPTDGEDFDLAYVADTGTFWRKEPTTGWVQITDFDNPLPAATRPGEFLSLDAGGNPIWSRVPPSLQPFDPTKAYVADELVSKDGSIYRALGATPPSATLSAVNWLKIAPASAVTMPIVAFDPGTAYKVGDLIVQNSRLYRAKVNVAGGAFSANQWEWIDKPPILDLFDPAKSYAANDLVVNGGNVYRAAKAITPGPWTAGDWLSLGWTAADLISGIGLQAFYTTNSYAAGTLVSNAGSIYRAKAAVTAGAFNVADWIELGAPPAQGVAVYDPTVSYNAKDLVAKDGELYRAKTVVAAGPFSAPDWDLVAPKPDAAKASIYPFDPTATYTSNRFVTEAGKVYRSKTAVTAGAFNVADWELVGPKPDAAIAAIYPFNAAANYAANDLVTESGIVYRAKAPIVAGLWSAADWDQIAPTLAGAASASIAGEYRAAAPSAADGEDDDTVFVYADKTVPSLGKVFESADQGADQYGMGMKYTSSGPIAGVEVTFWDAVGDFTATIDNIPAGLTKAKITIGGFSWTMDGAGSPTWTVANGTYVTANTPPNFTGTQADWDALRPQFFTPNAALPSTIVIEDAATSVPDIEISVYKKAGGAWDLLEDLSARVDSAPDALVRRDSAGRLLATELSLAAAGNISPKVFIAEPIGHGVCIGHGAAGSFAKYNQGIAIGLNAYGSAGGSAKTGCGTVVGKNALSAITGDAPGETAIGTEALGKLGSASNNTAVGYMALSKPVKITQCLGVGSQAGEGLGEGSTQITAVGVAAAMNCPANTKNSTAIGYGSQITASNQITLGDSNVTVLRCAVRTITALSDERDKTNIQNLSLGLDFIKGLRPVSFDWNRRDGGGQGSKSIGFIAQEVLEAENNSGMRDHLNMVSDTDPEKLEMSDGELIPVLTKAVQELSAQIDDLKAEIAALKGA